MQSVKNNKKCNDPLENDFVATLQSYELHSSKLQSQIDNFIKEKQLLRAELDKLRATNEHLKKHQTFLVTPEQICYPPCCKPTSEIYAVSPCEEKRRICEQKLMVEDNIKNKQIEMQFVSAINEKLEQQVEEAEAELASIREQIDICLAQLGRSNSVAELELKRLEDELLQNRLKYRETEVDLEEYKNCINTLDCQLDIYNTKCDEASQLLATEQDKLSCIQSNFNNIKDEIQMKIEEIKLKLQQTLDELCSLPEVLKEKQVQLKCDSEAYKDLLDEIDDLKYQMKKYVDRINELEAEIANLEKEEGNLGDKMAALQNKYDELQSEVENLQSEITDTKAKIEEQLADMEQKEHEIVLLRTEVDDTERESKAKVNRTKEQCELNRQLMEKEIMTMELELVYSRRAELTAEVDRDEMANKMRREIKHLRNNFDEATSRIRTLEGQMDIFNYTVEKPMPPFKLDSEISLPCECGALGETQTLLAAKKQWCS